MKTEPTGFPLMCDGGCGLHVGRCRIVHVVDSDAGKDWGRFLYCENAVEEDRSRGFAVEEEVA